MRGLGRTFAVAIAALTAIVVSGGAAQAQTQAPKQKRPPRAKTLSFGGVWIAPLSLGTATAGLERPDGSQLVVFQAENDLGPGLGVETGLAIELRRNFLVEISGGWVHTELRTRVSDDVESAPDLTLTETLTRFSVEASGLWQFRTRGATVYFVRGGAGWMRELTGGASLVEDGVVANGGLGLRHLVAEQPARQPATVRLPRRVPPQLPLDQPLSSRARRAHFAGRDGNVGDWILSRVRPGTMGT